MKHTKLFLKLIPVFLFFSSCAGNSENARLIIGAWDGVTWIADGRPSDLKATATHFHFDEKGKYIYDYAGTKEEGTYKVENDMLFTTPNGDQEMMVKIAKLTMDSLVFDMSRGGQPESLTLIKKK